jgi:hypothetical protein
MRNEPQRYAADKNASKAIRKLPKRGDRKLGNKLKASKKGK